MGKHTAPYGSWRSPITSAAIVSEGVALGMIQLDGTDIYWVEARPSEAGRQVIVCATSTGDITDVTPPPFSARTRVHEYGGGAFVVARGTVFFSNDADQRIYRQQRGAQPRPITPPGPMRYADAVFDKARARLICVREEYSAHAEPENSIVGVDLAGAAEVRVLTAGNDFYSSPRLSRNGHHLAWLDWSHPNMPWDETRLWVAPLQGDGRLGHAQCVAGGACESVFQPEWSPDGTLYFVSDRHGWWNLYRWRDGRVEPVVEMDAEFGLPQWAFGMSTYAFESARRIVCSFNRRGSSRLAVIDTEKCTLKRIAVPYTDVYGLRAAPGNAVFVAGSPTVLAAIVRLDLGDGRIDVLRRSSNFTVDTGYLSPAREVSFPTQHGRTAHAFFYPPHNRDYAPPQGTRAPAIVTCHGGPTGTATSTLNLKTQFWTSRGFGVLGVNYGGSTGYGRAYRERLNGQWGIVDVEDCVNAARHLIAQGQVDAKRIAIAGGSAGGYTVLCALTFHDLFKAGVSYYGVSDLESLAKETHKFESHYLDRLVGPYPEQSEIYRARSPVHFADRLSCPMIFFQGLQDRVVPPSQTEQMVSALRSKGVPVAYIAFADEQHGFRRAESIKAALDAELYFYSRVFGFELSEPVEPIAIENL